MAVKKEIDDKNKKKKDRTVVPVLPVVQPQRSILIDFEHPDNEQELNEQYQKAKEEKEKRPKRTV